LKLVSDSNLPSEVKENGKRVYHYSMTRVALAKKDLAGAKKEADEFRKGAASAKNPLQMKNSHELDGLIALAEKDWDKAIAELSQANQQNPEDFYRLGQAYRGKGDAAKAVEMCHRAAAFHGLPNVNYAFIRTKAKAEAGSGGPSKS
jgi:tetratricopeptide (TPR) repeat protein